MNKKEKSQPEESYSTNAAPRPKARYLVGFIVCALMLGGSYSVARYFWLNQEETERRTPPPKIPLVQGVRLHATNFPIHLPSQGRVQARALTSISPEVAGRIVSIESIFKEGGFFQPGQKLLTLDDADYLNEVVKAKAIIAQLKAKLELEKIERAAFTNAVAVAEANLEQANLALKLEILERSGYSNAVAVAQANFAQSDAALKLELARRDAAIANLKRLGSLEKASPLAKYEPQVAEAMANTNAKRATLDKTLEDLSKRPAQMEANLEAKIKVANVKLTEAREDLKRPAQLEADLLAQIRIAESEARQAERNAKRTVIIAPKYHGRITEKRVDIGQVVNAGAVLATAIATDYAEVRLPISNHRLAYLNVPEQMVSTNNTEALKHQAPITYPAVKLTAQIGADAHTWQGKIDRAESRYDSASQQLFLIAQVPEPYGHQPPLRAGLFVRADITGKTLNNVFILPRHTVRRGNEVALAIKDGNQTILTRKKIEVLWRDEKVMITQSLETGDVLITTPIDYATNGQELLIHVKGEAAPAPPKRPPFGKGGPGKGKGKGPGRKKGQPKK